MAEEETKTVTKQEEAPAEEDSQQPPVEEDPYREIVHEGPSVDLPLPPLFGKYESKGIVLRDRGLARYVQLDTIGIPHQGAKYANRQFGKARTSIVERLINGMMRTMTYTGKKMKSYRVVEDAFAIVEAKKKENPIQILVRALENASPKEEITRLRYGGINVPKAVDTSPQRRLDIALRNICVGATQATFGSRKPIAQCLADELMKAADDDMQSFSVAKKSDLERVAKSAR